MPSKQSCKQSFASLHGGKQELPTMELQISDTAMFSIGELATLLGKDRKTIRNYTEPKRADGTAKYDYLRFKVSKVNGRKVFTGREVKRFINNFF